MKFYICKDRKEGFSWNKEKSSTELPNFREMVEFDSYTEFAFYSHRKYNIPVKVMKAIVDWDYNPNYIFGTLREKEIGFNKIQILESILEFIENEEPLRIEIKSFVQGLKSSEERYILK